MKRYMFDYHWIFMKRSAFCTGYHLPNIDETYLQLSMRRDSVKVLYVLSFPIEGTHNPPYGTYLCVYLWKQKPTHMTNATF